MPLANSASLPASPLRVLLSPVAPIQTSFAEASGQGVVGAVDAEPVVVVVGGVAAEQLVLVAVEVQLIGAGIAKGDVQIADGCDIIVAIVSVQHVLAAAAVDPVIAAVAVDGVVAERGGDDIRAAEGIDQLAEVRGRVDVRPLGELERRDDKAIGVLARVVSYEGQVEGIGYARQAVACRHP